MQRGRQRRRQIIVDKTLQSRIAFTAAWPPALCVALATVLLGVYCSRLHEEELLVDAELPSIVPVFAIGVAFMLIATVYTFYSAIRFSHRVAGPMVNIGNTLERFRGGDRAARVRLREKDYLGKVANDVNQLLEWVADQAPAGTGAADQADEAPAPTATESDQVESPSSAGV